MTKARQSRKLNRAILRHKGFTLVELIVVLCLMSILLGIAVFSGVAWIEWANFNKENDAAEEIFYATQNQLTELDSSGALNRRLQNGIINSSGEYSDDLVLGKGTDSVASNYDFNGIIYSDGSSCTWESVWKNGEDDNNYSKVERTIVRVVTEAGDYTRYLNGEYKNEVSGTSGAAKKFLFDMIASFISDKTVLDGSIAVEFSPEAGQVFAVCYSDRAKSFSYTQVTGGGVVNIKDRSLTTRKDILLGYYGVDSLTAKMKGHSVSSGGYKLELQNATTLNMILSKENEAAAGLGNNDKVTFSIEGSEYYDGNYSPKFSFVLTYGEIAADSFEAAIASPMTITPVFESGSSIYSSDSSSDGEEDITFKIPVWKHFGKVYVILDAADVQAQSLLYGIAKGDVTSDATSEPTSQENARKLFRNTYSFYRFGLTNVNYIRANASISRESDPTNTEQINGCRLDQTEYGNEAEDIHGECVAFANWEEGDTTFAAATQNPNITKIYGIKNGRHFYNLRYETDYKKNKSERRFELRNDIDWNDMLSGSNQKGLGLVDTNFFLNSYDSRIGSEHVESGIDCQGLDDALLYKVETGGSLDSYNYPSSDTSKYYFPGFRMLGYGDTFTQTAVLDVENPVIDKNEEGHPYTISNINISFVANCLYGVYGEEVRNCVKGGGDTAPAKAMVEKVNTLSKTGALPLGLFAENLGSISNVELDDVTVIGMQAFPLQSSLSETSQFIYTSKVGAFVGENLGTVSNLFVDVNSSENKSFINGRTDVGGIVGHQYYTVMGNSSASQYSLEGCVNSADVRGLAYVGGIIGRIYPKGNNGDANKSCDVKINNKYFSDVYITKDSLSTLSVTAKAIEKFTIDKCKNYGEISVDELVAKYGISGAYFRRGFYFGGITGATINPVNGMNYGATYQPTNPIAIIKDCTSVTLYTDSELAKIFDKESDEYYGKRRLRANYVGGITGGARHATLINCSTTPDSDAEGRSFVFGDRYVGGVTGYSKHSVFKSESTEGQASYTSRELAKIGATEADGYRSDYNIINGTDVLGNYAVGGISGTFGFQARMSSAEYYGNKLETLMTSQSLSGDSSYIWPYGSRFTNATDNYVVSNLLNTGVVLGNSQSCQNDYLSSETERAKHVGLYFNIVGGVAGYLNERMNNADNIQSEEDKCFALKMYGFTVGEGESVSDVLETITDDSLQNIINNSAYVSDIVGGIAGEAGRGCSIDESKNNQSRVDAVVFGRNRVGGIVGDTTIEYDRCGGAIISNVYPYKHVTSSSGLVVMGKDAVGGIVGAFSDAGSPLPKGADVKNWGGRLNSSLTSDNKALYDENAITDGYTVMGKTAVGGVIGFFADIGKISVIAKSYTINFKIGSENSTADNKVSVRGNLFTGGVVGYLESSSDVEYANGRFRVEAYNMDIKSKCFAGCFAGAAIGSTKYVPLDKVVTGNSIVKNVAVKSEVASGGFIGIYGLLNDNNGAISKYSLTDTDTSVFRSIKTNGNSVTVDSKLGISNETIKEITWNSVNESNTAVSNESYQLLVNAFQNFKGASSEIYNLQSMSGFIAESSGVSVESLIYAGGLIGYIPDGINLELQNYTNNASIKTTGYVVSEEAGSGDSTKYSYLGGIVGRVPLNVTLSNCKNNVNGENYKAEKADYLGGLTELNAGTITGSVVSGNVTPVINSTDYSYSYGGVAGFVGVNGNRYTDGINNGIVSNCSNVATIDCETVAGIVSVIGGPSTIERCINHGNIKARSVAEHGTYGAGAGIVCDILSSVSGDITIKDCVNTGKITVDGNVDTSMAAGITCNSNNSSTETYIVLCRNYGTGLKYGITVTSADCMYYCFDASDSEYHMDSMITNESGDLVHATPYMISNFFIGEDTFFNVKQYYSTTANANQNIPVFTVSEDTKTDINELVLGEDKLNEGNSDLDVTAPNWGLDSDVSDCVNDYCSFEIKAVDIDGNEENSVSAYMKDFSIVWDNYYKKEQDRFADYMNPEKNVHYQEWYADFVGVEGVDYNTQTYRDVAMETIRTQRITNFPYTSMDLLFTSFIGLKEYYKELYGISAYGHFLYNDAGDDDYVYVLRSKTASRVVDGFDFGLFPGDFNTPAKKYRKDSIYYSEPDIVGGYFSPTKKTFLDYAVQELNYGSSTYCSEEDLLPNKKEYKKGLEEAFYSYVLYSGTYNEQQVSDGINTRYIASYSDYDIKLEDNTTSKYSRDMFMNGVPDSNPNKAVYDAYSRYCFGVYCLMREDAEEGKNSYYDMSASEKYDLYIDYLYKNIDIYGYRNWDYSGYLKYHLVFTDVDGNTLSTGLLTAGLNDESTYNETNGGYYYIDKYSMSDFGTGTGSYTQEINGVSVAINKSENFDSSRIKKIDIIVQDIYDGLSPERKQVGLRGFKWTDSTNGVESAMKRAPLSGGGSTPNAQSFMNEIMSDGNNSPLSKFYSRSYTEGGNTKYKLLLSGAETNINKITNNPYDDTYWNENTDYTEQTKDSLVRYKMYEEIDPKFREFIVNSISGYSGENAIPSLD